MVIPHFNAHVGAQEKGSHMADSSLLAGVYKNKSVNSIPGYGIAFHKTEGCSIQTGKNFLEAPFLSARKKEYRRSIEAARGQHGCKGIKIGIGMAGDEC